MDRLFFLILNDFPDHVSSVTVTNNLLTKSLLTYLFVVITSSPFSTEPGSYDLRTKVPLENFAHHTTSHNALVHTYRMD